MKCYSFKLLIVFLNTELFISRRYIQQFKNGRDHSAPWNCYINVAFLNNRYNVLENLWFLCDVSYTFACIRTSHTCNIPEMSLKDKDRLWVLFLIVWLLKVYMYTYIFMLHDIMISVYMCMYENCLWNCLNEHCYI